MTDITQCAGYISLRAAVDRDHEKSPGFHRYDDKFDWAIERAKHYGESLDMDPVAILDAWENDRDYWYMNYYQDCNQPKISDGSVRVFETVDDLKTSIARPQYRCPACGGVSSNPYTCDSGIERDGKPCDWKAYGLFGTLGKGAFVYVKEKLRGQSIFMPVAWEKVNGDG